ncbi:MAG: hypothetical protein ABJB33_04570 [Gemmatimonadota bacterium]
MTPRGFSQLELAVVLVLTALIAGLGVPALTHVADRAVVNAAAHRIIGAHREARLVAVTTQRMALLRLAADTLELRTALGGDTTLVWRRAGPRALGVEVIGNPRTMYFIPYGYTIGGSNTSYTLRKGSAQKKVIISRLGRVRVE